MKDRWFVAVLGVVTVVTPAAAQSFNIDFGLPNTGPPADYRADGIRGHWNSFEAVDSTVYQLIDIDGNLTGVMLSQFGGTEIVEAALEAGGDPRGSHRILLKDAMVTHTTIESCLFFNNLVNGTYEVTTYAWMPTAPTTPNNVHVDFNPAFYLVGAPWSGAHAELGTFARHIVDVNTGFLGPHSGVPSGGDYLTGAALNGIQVRLMNDEAPLYLTESDLTWLAALDALRYDVVRGELSTLRSTGGDFTAATDSCHAENHSAQAIDHLGDPPSGEAYWYVVRGTTTGGPQTYDTSAGTQVGARDAEINASPLSCSAH